MTKGKTSKLKNSAKKSASKKAAATIHRFAHPFFTLVPVNQRKNIAGVGNQMTDHIQSTLLPFPDPIRNPPQMTLDDVIGADSARAIGAGKSITFHATGDTGHNGGGTENMQEYVAGAMTLDYDIGHPEKSPAFFLHLGDVNYYNNTDAGYHEQFYTPYKLYPGKIIAIPGNHDGEIFKFDGSSTGQKTTLEAFSRNFVQPKPSVPPAAGTIFRQMVSQPGFYWSLSAPFVDILGLYSNMAENPGYLAAPSIGTKQTDWLGNTLTAIAKARQKGPRKALIIAVHHPPFSGGGHGSSTEMLAQIDDACTRSHIMPDAVLAAHSHDYQAYTRYLTFEGKDLQIPFLVAGGGGRGLSPAVPKVTGVRDGDHLLDKSLRGYGYLTVTVTASDLSFIFNQVAPGGKTTQFDSLKVNLATHKVSR